MFRLSDLQAVEPEYLTKNPDVLVELASELDGMGFNRVDLVAATSEAIVAYADENWGQEDPDWFAEYVVARVVELPLPFNTYRLHTIGVEAYADCLVHLVALDRYEFSDEYKGVTSWEELHGVCDANEYLIAANEKLGVSFGDGEQESNEYNEFANEAIRIAETRLFKTKTTKEV